MPALCGAPASLRGGRSRAWMAGTSPAMTKLFRKLGKLPHHPCVSLPLERHHQRREIVHFLPAPGDEFRLVAAAGIFYIDLTVIAGEAQSVPFLLLPAIFSVPGGADDVARDVVVQPLADLAEFLDRADIGLLIKFAQRGLVAVLAVIDAALRHLPDMAFINMFRPAGA